MLERLRDLFQDPKMGLKPARGTRQGSAYELAVTAVHDRLAALCRPAANVHAIQRSALLAADAHVLI